MILSLLNTVSIDIIESRVLQYVPHPTHTLVCLSELFVAMPRQLVACYDRAHYICDNLDVCVHVCCVCDQITIAHVCDWITVAHICDLDYNRTCLRLDHDRTCLRLDYDYT